MGHAASSSSSGGGSTTKAGKSSAAAGMISMNMMKMMMPIISKMYCSAREAVLVVRRRPAMVGGGGFVVMNSRQEVVFKVEGCGILGKKGELILRDACHPWGSSHPHTSKGTLEGLWMDVLKLSDMVHKEMRRRWRKSERRTWELFLTRSDLLRGGEGDEFCGKGERDGKVVAEGVVEGREEGAVEEEGAGEEEGVVGEERSTGSWE
ncbi:hypothetical protein Dimus_021519 [Dionaea muscipula]